MLIENNFIKNHDKSDDEYRLTCRLLGGLLKDKDQRSSYFKENINGKFSIDDIYKISRINNVIMRILDYLCDINDKTSISKWKEIAQNERHRCKKSIKLIKEILKSFDEDAIKYVIIKTLDSYPDFGNDVDIFVAEQFEIMKNWIQEKYKGKIRKRKISEVLCGKMSMDMFDQALLEVHCGKMGQVGEQPMLAESIIKNRRLFQIDGLNAYIPSLEDRIIILTIHRLYRHFSFKIADIVNAITFLKDKNFNWEYLLKFSDELCIKEGVSYLLGLLENVHVSYFKEGFLPKDIKSSINNEAELFFRHYFFRIPLFRIPAKLYTSETLTFLKKGKMESVARLSLVPALSLIAYVTIKIFKDDWVW